MSNFEKISNLKSFDDIATYFGISTGYLQKIIIQNKRYNYTKFSIPKKDGTLREIYSPKGEVSVLQNKLKLLLEESFNPHHKAFGFIKNKNFISNASNHVRKKFVLNLDLENFFESISFGRVRQMFIAYFKLDPKVATTLANVCCHYNGFLPQGASTSPIISNIITKPLDKELTELAKKCTLTYYTRYVDDITFSTNNDNIPNQLAKLNIDNSAELAPSLIKIINKNGFKINEKKVRIQSSKGHQEVTGITVNKKVNINRRYIKNLRATIYSFLSNMSSPDIPLDIFKEEYKKKKGKPSIRTLDQAFRIIKGRILHVSHIKGKKNTVFLKLATDYNQMINYYETEVTKIKLPTTDKEFLTNNTVVINPINYRDPFYINENDELDDIGYGQGTGFYLKEIGLITNYHVVEYLITEVLEKELKFCKEYYIEYYTESNGIQNTFKAKIKYYDKEKDIAILKPQNPSVLKDGFIACTNPPLGDPIILSGFPNHEVGNNLRIDTGKIIRAINTEENKRFEISANIYAGNSGGPVLNMKNEVIGIAVRGFTDAGTVPSEYIPIKDAIELYQIEEVGV